MNTEELLTKTRELLTPREAWTQGCLAAIGRGVPCSPLNPDASCWCLAGAMLKSMNAADPDKAGVPYDRARVLLRDAIGQLRSIASFNDDPRTTHVAVLGALDRAIILARS